MCGYICIGFIDFMFLGKTLTDLTKLFSSHSFKKNGKVILNYFLKKIISMSKAHVCEAKDTFLQFDNTL